MVSSAALCYSAIFSGYVSSYRGEKGMAIAFLPSLLAYPQTEFKQKHILCTDMLRFIDIHPPIY